MNEFELFKSNICQYIKNKNSQDVINEFLKDHIIDEYFNNEEYDKALYIVAMIEYLCRRDSLQRITELNKYRKYKLQELCYPASVELIHALIHDGKLKKKALKHAEPEFLKYNTVEDEIENVY